MASKDRAQLPILQQRQSKYQKFVNLFISRFLHEDTAALKSMASDNFCDRIAFYKQKRDEFRNNPTAMAELAKWKNHCNDCDYTVLKGLIPLSCVGQKESGSKPFEKSDTWFSEFELHNDDSLVLSESTDSYIIGNLASYDRRQYPEWFDKKYTPGSITPEGQAFGHTLIVSKQRVYNVVDPDATANHSALLEKMKAHFVEFWNEGDSGKTSLLNRTKLAFDSQNDKLASEKGFASEYNALLPQITADFETMSKEFLRLKIQDFVIGVHPHPDISVGHLHMHAFPKVESLRKFSSKHHDWKTIALEAILEAEAQDHI